MNYHTESFIRASTWCLSLSLQLALFFPPFLSVPLFLFTICQQKNKMRKQWRQSCLRTWKKMSLWNSVSSLEIHFSDSYTWTQSLSQTGSYLWRKCAWRMGQRSIRSSQLPDLWPLSWKNPFWPSLSFSQAHTDHTHTQGSETRVKKHNLTVLNWIQGRNEKYFFMSLSKATTHSAVENNRL